ncbi:Hypothetical_protein [Hexamita inflata]|uniref:Hypothetical_protein n=1 Tax=Hexamita inflata TaxID=28002 RepID=A0ABP1K1A5_9EUKA
MSSLPSCSYYCASISPFEYVSFQSAFVQLSPVIKPVNAASTAACEVINVFSLVRASVACNLGLIETFSCFSRCCSCQSTRNLFQRNRQQNNGLQIKQCELLEGVLGLHLSDDLYELCLNQNLICSRQLQCSQDL